MLNVTKMVENGKAEVFVEGRLDTSTVPELEAVLKGITGELSELTLNLEKLEYISSAGLHILLTTQREMDKHGVMKVTHVNQTIMEIFEMTGFKGFLTIE